MGRISTAERKLQLEREASGDHLYANRIRVYPKAVHGVVRNAKWAVLIACLTVYYALPWLRWNRGPGFPNQALLLDIADRRFYLFNLVLWPEDIYYLTGLLILGAVGLFLVTSLFGRVWCGYACPQTVWTDLFMWVERLLEGDRRERMRRDALPMNFDTWWRKAAKHTIWLAMAFWTGGAWIMYYVNAPTAVAQFWTGTASTEVYVFTFIFTFFTYLLAGWAREQVCTFMCPWPRFQSAMFDEQTFTVTYQAWRGEKRGHVKAQSTEKLGDCIDCGACVTACPTGIDIRDGVQLECIGCGLCIDACNDVMTRVDRKPWLITWDSLARQADKAKGAVKPIRLLRPRTIIYASAMVLALAVMGTALATRGTIGLSLQQDRAPLFVRLPDGTFRNGFTAKISNKTLVPASFTLTLSGLEHGRLALAETNTDRSEALRLQVPADQVGTFRILVFGESHDRSHPMHFVLRRESTGETTQYDAAFMGPGERKSSDEH